MNPPSRRPPRLADVDIRLIRVFVTVVKCSGMAAAELELNVGRSTISRHVKDLEIRLGVTLCHRGRGGFALTPEGRRVYGAAEQLLASLDHFQSEVSGLRGPLTGQLTLSLFDKTVTNPKARVHESIARFNQRAPDVEIHVRVQPLNDIERAVIEGDCQLGIIPTHRTSASLVYLPLFDEQMYLYCGAGHPLYDRAEKVKRDEILSQAYAGMGFHSPNMEVGNRLGWRRRATAYDQEAVATLIRSGRFLGFLPEHYATSFVAAEQMRRIGGDEFQYRCHFAAIHRRAPKPGPVLAEFLCCLDEGHRRGC